MRTIRASRAAQGMIACLVMMSVVGVVLLVLFAKQRLTKPSRVDVPQHPAEHPAEQLAAKYEGGPGASSAEYIEAGRLLLKAGLAQQAALWLFRAYQQGDRTPLLRHLLAEAIRVASAAAARLPIAGVTDGALSSDGRLAAVVDKDGILTLHDAESGQLLETLSDTEPDDQTGPAESVVFLRDGKHLPSVHKPDETQYTIRRWRQPQPGAPFEHEYEIDCPDVGSGSIERLMLAPDEHYLYDARRWELGGGLVVGAGLV